MSRGHFIVLEGGEGVGKTTQLRLLTEWAEGLGLRLSATREPGGTEVGEAIREVLLHRVEMAMPSETELFLMLAARAAFVRDVVRPALERGEIVVADRFDLSTLAYQGFGRGLDMEKVRRMNAFATGGLRPDLYVVLDLPVSDGLLRKEEAPKEIIVKSVVVDKSNYQDFETPIDRRPCPTIESVAGK